MAATTGIRQRHGNGCKRPAGGCDCPYVVVWRTGGKQHKQTFPTLELAREFKPATERGGA